MKVGVLGGGGFLGSAICDRLLKDGYRLKIFERPGISSFRIFSENEQVEWIMGDFSSVYDIETFINGVDVVIHLVSSTLPGTSNEDMVFDVQSNVISTLHLLNSMVAKGIKKIIFVSSGGTVYGNPKYTPLDEGHPTNPIVSYGITKLAIEKYLLLYQGLHGIKATILRVANPYGERQRVETAQGTVGIFLSKALSQEPIEIWGDGSVIRDYIYVGDVADAVAKALDYDGEESIFNIGSGSGKSLNELISTIKEIVRLDFEVRYLPSRSFDVPINVLNSSLALKELRWDPKIEFYEGIKKTAAWMSSNFRKKSNE